MVSSRVCSQLVDFVVPARLLSNQTHQTSRRIGMTEKVNMVEACLGTVWFRYGLCIYLKNVLYYIILCYIILYIISCRSCKVQSWASSLSSCAGRISSQHISAILSHCFLLPKLFYILLLFLVHAGTKNIEEGLTSGFLIASDSCSSHLDKLRDADICTTSNEYVKDPTSSTYQIYRLMLCAKKGLKSTGVRESLLFAIAHWASTRSTTQRASQRNFNISHHLIY